MPRAFIFVTLVSCSESLLHRTNLRLGFPKMHRISRGCGASRSKTEPIVLRSDENNTTTGVDVPAEDLTGPGAAGEERAHLPAGSLGSGDWLRGDCDDADLGNVTQPLTAAAFEWIARPATPRRCAHLLGYAGRASRCQNDAREAASSHTLAPSCDG